MTKEEIAKAAKEQQPVSYKPPELRTYEGVAEAIEETIDEVFDVSTVDDPEVARWRRLAAKLRKKAEGRD